MKILYCFPAVLYGGLLALIGSDLGFGGFEPEAWVYIALLVLSAVLLCKNKWWGCIPGMAVGGIVVYLFENTSAHQHINANPIGIGIIAYFAVMGLFCHKLNKEK